MKYVKHKQNDHKGYVLLLSMLIISIFLSISFGVYALSIKELVLSSFLRGSETAFLAADRTAECALYWDRIHPGLPFTPFATSTLYLSGGQPYNTGIMKCGGPASPPIMTTPANEWNTNPVPPGPTAISAWSTFKINYGASGCADVSVYKWNDETTVTVNGFNTCDTTSVTRAARTIQVHTNN